MLRGRYVELMSGLEEVRRVGVRGRKGGLGKRVV